MLSSLCVNLVWSCGSEPCDGYISAEVVLYDDEQGRPAERASWAKHYEFLGLAGGLTRRWASNWLSREPSELGLLLTAPRAHVGVRATVATGSLGCYVTRGSVGRMLHSRALPNSTWQQLRGDWDAGNSTGVEMKMVGRPVAAVPPAWRCSPELYADGRACECECGAWDPDCNASVAGSAGNCSDGGACDWLGRCVRPNWNTTLCNLSSYGSGDGCQCACGDLVDPDCRTSVVAGTWYPPATNCPGAHVAKCGDDNRCAETWPSCSAERYGDGFCDCTCQRPRGVLDVDCIDRPLDTDCGWAACFAGACRAYPVNWTCEIDRFGGRDCDCGCGAYDPPCETQALVGGSAIIGCSVVEPVCSAATYTYCGNSVVEPRNGAEQCDRGPFCGADCKCVAGYVPTSPPTRGCQPSCGDGVVEEGEQCDREVFCDNASCTCLAGHPHRGPLASPGCSGCGNGVADELVGEECEGGDHCIAGNCTCAAAYRPTVPVSQSCVPIRCGDGVASRGEQCDGGLFCNATCGCDEGHRPYAPPRRPCTGCGNGVLDAGDGEMCDSGPHCAPDRCVCSEGFNATTPLTTGCREPLCGNGRVDGSEECDSGKFCQPNCSCVPGYAAAIPPSQDCQKPDPSMCGNGVINVGEECDGGLFCDNSRCACEAGHRPLAVRGPHCAGCGNAIVDKALGEHCDGGDGCTQNCTCADQYVPTTPDATIGCLHADAIAALVCVLVYRKRARRVKQLANMPIEESHSVNFATVSPAPESSAQQMTPVTPVMLAPDGTPVVVVHTRGSSGTLALATTTAGTLALFPTFTELSGTAIG
eukprot:m51a1_g12454 putative lipoprotein (814) ;mRNA; f:408-4418